MFDWYKKLFGEGEIRVEMTTADGRRGIGKVPYIGDIDTIDLDEFREDVKRQIFVKNGEVVTSVRIIGWY